MVSVVNALTLFTVDMNGRPMMRFHRVEGGVGVGKEVGNLIHSYVDLGYGRSVVDTANLLCYEVQENSWFDSKKFSCLPLR